MSSALLSDRRAVSALLNEVIVLDAFIQYGLIPLLIFLMAMIYIRLSGKKAVTEMSNADVLFVLILGVILSGPLVSSEPLDALAYSFLFLLAYVLFTYAAQYRRFRPLLVSPPTVLLRNGDIDEKGLQEARMTTSQLLSALRQRGITKTGDVEMAVMEDTGKISVIPKAHARPLQPQDIQLHPTPEYVPIPLIMDGELLRHNLRYLEKEEGWLDAQLQAFGLNKDQIADISLAVYHQDGSVSIDRKKSGSNKGRTDSAINEVDMPENAT
ncbi:DUF421 domain-containing protein [Alteribacillus iranensis]|uniref:Uncharacterized membrane protein YcaP, DUF421 family n=1 Tax=Alteribacillus iranensis TaxID=930128 RepID=A0A1I2BNG0_9BACI|nr:DUF421 domain-containing protein [Alteribacillus iranensis]SFE57599.1 Uncharacterized membrane protein YcaP, DUF421 family [Alteribacillus iranensis]